MSSVRVAILIVGLLVPTVALAAGADISLWPSYATYPVGQQFDEQVLVDTHGTAINAAEAEIDFDPAVLAVDRVSTDNSLLDSWPAAPQFSNTTGKIRFTGSSADGFTGSNGLLVTITFHALQNEDSNVQFASSAVLAADGTESNIVSSMTSAELSIRPIAILPTVPTTTESDASTSEAVPQQLVRPTFSFLNRDIAIGQPIVVQGTTTPEVKVDVWMQKGDGATNEYSVESGADGSFAFVSASPAESGIYVIWAAAEDQNGAQGPVSDSITLSAQSDDLAAAALFVSGVTLDLLPYAALIVFGGLACAYMYHRHKLAVPERSR